MIWKILALVLGATLAAGLYQVYRFAIELEEGFNQFN
jgi:hypothetical protein